MDSELFCRWIYFHLRSKNYGSLIRGGGNCPPSLWLRHSDVCVCVCVCVCVVGRPVHVLMLSIQAVRGLPRLRASGIMLLALSRSEKRRVTNNRVRRARACARLKSENSTYVVSETPAHLLCVLASLRCVNVSARSSAITADSAAQRSTNDSRYVKLILKTAVYP